MPRTRSLAWSELKIGIVAVIALGLASAIIVAVGGASGFFWQRYELKTKFADVKGLKSGAVVRVAGVEVGKVSEISFSGANVEVVLEVKKGNERGSEPARRAHHRHQPIGDRHTAQGRRLHPVGPYARPDR
jgi:ABC-type transporter Mla subunit MlaD